MSLPFHKIAVASIGDPREWTTWSGIPSHLSMALEREGIEVIRGGPLPAKEPLYYRWLRAVYWRLGYGWFMSGVEPLILKQYSLALRDLRSTA